MKEGIVASNGLIDTGAMPEQTDLTKVEYHQIKIDGVVTAPLGNYLPYLIDGLRQDLSFPGYPFQGNISPLNPDGESFMVSVPKTELDKLKKDLQFFVDLTAELQVKDFRNDKAFKKLAERCQEAEESIQSWTAAYNYMQSCFIALQQQSNFQKKVIQSLRNKEGRWETFKKWFNKTFKI